MTETQNPKQKARDNIDALLKRPGWIVQLAKRIDLNARIGLVVRVTRVLDHLGLPTRAPPHSPAQALDF